MNIEKLPSGSYRVRKQVNGKRHSAIFDHKPTKKEVDEYFANLIVNPVTMRDFTFEDATLQMFQDKENVLSPATIRGYNNNLKQIRDEFKHTRLDDITIADIQREINYQAGRVSAKTVSNYNGLISSVFALYRPDFSYKVKLPMKIQKDPYVPDKEKLDVLLEDCRGTVYELPILLGCYGMRRSEICALDDSCVDGNTIHIEKTLVQDKDDNWILKPIPKTSKSARDIIVDDYVINLINEKGFYKGHPHTISDWMRREEYKLGLEHFPLHKLRHYFASYLHSIGVPDADIQKFGGWSTDNVMKRVYRHATNTTQNVSDQISKGLFS